MTNLARHQGGGIIALSFMVALFLSVMPLPAWLEKLRPEWVALFVLYWCLALPERIGVGSAWLVGLLLDVLRGAVLGQHALALTVVAYLAILLHQRIRVYPLPQQSLSVLVLIIMFQLLIQWVNGVIGKPPSNWTYWLPSFSSMLLWPVVYAALRGVRRSFGVT